MFANKNIQFVRLLICTWFFAFGLVFPGKLTGELTEKEKKVNDAIGRGITYLRKVQTPNGSFGNGITLRRNWPVGFTALPALALLESGVAADDPAVQRAAALTRRLVMTEARTYEISLAILFLDRLGEKADVPLLRTLALRLVAGQGQSGGWGYRCPLLSPPQEKKFLDVLHGRKPEDAVRALAFPGPKAPSEEADNSNTQFAILALWVSRKQEIPLDFTLGLAELRFRASQKASGWSYRVRGVSGGKGSMTCVGLLGLAIGRGAEFDRVAGPGMEKLEDAGMKMGLVALTAYMKDPSDSHLDNVGWEYWGPEGAVNLYFLWSVERVGVLCNLKTIGGKDWYQWGVDLLLPTQRPDGSWIGRGNGASGPIDTSMALLFLKGSDLLPDLRETLQKRLNITDPGASPGDKATPKDGGGKSPGEKPDGKGDGRLKKPGEKPPGPMSLMGPGSGEREFRNFSYQRRAGDDGQWIADRRALPPG